MTNSQKDAIQALADLSPQELVAAHLVARNAQLQGVEDAKKHPLRNGALLPDAEWQALCDHLSDGGGALNVRDLRTAAHQAFISRDQGRFFAALIDFFKADLKVGGHITALPNGGVAHAGVA